MPILSKTIQAIKGTGQGVAAISSGLLSVGKGLANTTKKIAGAITGGPRQQTYGYFADLFDDPRKPMKRKERVTQIREIRKPNLMTPNYGDSTEALNEIFDFMKMNQDKQLRQLQVQKSFDEEKLSEENRRHKELLEAINKFIDVKVTTVTKVEPEQPKTTLMDDILSGIKSMVEGIIKNAVALIEKTIEGIKTTLNVLKEAYDILKPYISAIGRFFTSPLFMSVLGPALLIGSLAAFLKTAADEKAAIEANPYDEKYKDNAYAMTLRGEATSVAQATQQNIAKTIKTFRRKEVEDFVNSDQTDAELLNQFGQDRAGLKSWLSENPKPSAVYQAPVRGMGTTGGSSVAPMPDQTDAETARLSRQNAAPPATATVTTTPTVPVSAPVAQMTSENKDLEDNRVVATESSKSPIIMKTGSSEVKNDTPIPSTATQRDEEPMASRVFDTQRKKARAY
jgi:hypothetical protein